MSDSNYEHAAKDSRATGDGLKKAPKETPVRINKREVAENEPSFTRITISLGKAHGVNYGTKGMLKGLPDAQFSIDRLSETDSSAVVRQPLDAVKAFINKAVLFI